MLTEPLLERLEKQETDVQVIRVQKMDDGEHCDFFWSVSLPPPANRRLTDARMRIGTLTPSSCASTPSSKTSSALVRATPKNAAVRTRPSRPRTRLARRGTAPPRTSRS